MPCDPEILVRESVCIQCGIPSGMQSAVLISLLCQIRDNGGGGGGNFGAATLIVDNLPLNQPVILNQAHGLGGLPFLIQAHLKCVSAEHGYAVGDEIDITSIKDADAAQGDTFFTFGCNATNIYIITQTPAGVGSWSIPSINNKTGVGTINITVASWVAKFYAWR